MAKVTLSFSADGSQRIARAKGPRKLRSYFATIGAYGDFGGGSVVFSVSPDGGTTLLPMRDVNGAEASFTEADYTNVELAYGDRQPNAENLEIYAVVDGSTAANLTVFLFDQEH